MVSFYTSDFSKSELETQLELLGQMKIAVSGSHIQFCDIRKCFQSLPPAQLSLLSQVSLLVKLIALMPATNAVSERSASALRHVKTYLRSSMTQVRLNNIMVVHIHKSLTDTIDAKSILTEFLTANEERRKCLVALNWKTFIGRCACNCIIFASVSSILSFHLHYPLNSCNYDLCIYLSTIMI